MLETCFFLPCFNFQYQAGKYQKNVILYQYLATNGDAIITPAHSGCMDSEKKYFKNFNIRDMQNATHRNSPN